MSKDKPIIKRVVERLTMEQRIRAWLYANAPDWVLRWVVEAEEKTGYLPSGQDWSEWRHWPESPERSAMEGVDS